MIPHPIDQLTVKTGIAVRNLTIFPLHLSASSGPEYVTLSSAMASHGLVVKEVSDSGSVPDLLVENPSKQCVLLLDGEELRGAKQNRIINTTLLLAPQSRTTIPVSCTESGRWSYDTPTFSSAKTVMSVKARRKKTRSVSESLKEKALFHSDQGEVWQEVDELNSKVGSQSPTRAMAAAYERLKGELENAVHQIPYTEGQAGLIAFIDGEPAGMDVLSRPEVYAELHDQILHSYAMEALASAFEKGQLGKETKGSKQPTVDTLAARTFLERCAAIEGEAFDSKALGTDWRFVKEPIVGSGLEVEHTWIHMAYFMDPQGMAGKSGSRGRMVSMSRRARNRRQGGEEHD